MKENLLPAGEVDLEEVKLVLAANEDVAQVVGVFALGGGVACHGPGTSCACVWVLVRLLY